MAIAADVLVRPRLDAADWHRVRNDRRTAVVQRRDQPEAVVNVVSDRTLFGDAHPYGLPVDGLERTSTPSPSTTSARFTPPTTGPSHASLVVAGDFDEATLHAELEEAARRLEAGGPPPPAPHRRPGPSRPRLVIVDRPGAPQSIVRLVAPGIDRFAPERPGLSMLNAILGGSFTSRLNFNLREKHGYTYGAASSFSFLRHAGSFAARAAVFAESTAPAVREMLSELAGLRERPITAEEHAKARATLLMRVAEGLSSTGGMATTFGELGPLRPAARRADALRRRAPAHDRRRPARARRALRRSGRRLHRHRGRPRGDRARACASSACPRPCSATPTATGCIRMRIRIRTAWGPRRTAQVDRERGSSASAARA